MKFKCLVNFENFLSLGLLFFNKLVQIFRTSYARFAPYQLLKPILQPNARSILKTINIENLTCKINFENN